MYNFEFKQPTTISDAVNLLKSDEAQALGGGQTLMTGVSLLVAEQRMPKLPLMLIYLQD